MITLQDGVTEVRDALGEGTQWYFDTTTIIKQLNRSANIMCAASQFLRSTWQSKTGNIGSGPNTVQGQPAQEYQMPGDMIFPISAKIQIGILYPLSPYPQDQLQVGGFVQSTPFTCYVRRGTVLTSQIAGGGELVYPPPQSSGMASRSSWILGFYPIPVQQYNFFVNYVQYHPPMIQEMDPCLIPDEFFETWINYPIAMGKRKEGDMVSYAGIRKDFDDGCIAFRDSMLAQNIQFTPPMFGGGLANPLFAHGPGILVMAPLNSTIEMP